MHSDSGKPSAIFSQSFYRSWIIQIDTNVRTVAALLLRNNAPDKGRRERDKRLNMTDLDFTAVLRKTESGVNAIKIRDRALTPRLRMLLILVDGAKTVAELSKSTTSPDEARLLLGELLSAGFVQELDLPKPVAKPMPAPVPVKAVNPVPDEGLKAAIRRATHLLEDTLGPNAESLCLQIERCTNAAQFNAKVIEIARIVAAMRSEKKAAEFLLAALPSTPATQP